MAINYRAIRISEYAFLREMFYEALYVPEGGEAFPKSILEEPTLSKYLDRWGEKASDRAIVAVDKERLIGAIWGRCFSALEPSYGYVNDTTPEIGMALKSSYRRQGIGTRLLQQIEEEYVKSGVRQLSLSVDKLNGAQKLYTRLGYQFYEDCGTAITMLKIIL